MSISRMLTTASCSGEQHAGSSFLLGGWEQNWYATPCLHIFPRISLKTGFHTDLCVHIVDTFLLPSHPNFWFTEGNHICPHWNFQRVWCGVVECFLLNSCMVCCITTELFVFPQQMTVGREHLFEHPGQVFYFHIMSMTKKQLQDGIDIMTTAFCKHTYIEWLGVSTKFVYTIHIKKKKFTLC